MIRASLTNNDVINFSIEHGKLSESTLTLQRIDLNGLGYVLDPSSSVICFALELQYRNNQRRISSILPGIYEIKLEQHSRFGRCIRVLAVPNRLGILIHTANNQNQIKGCIAPGNSITMNYTVQDSTNALKRLCDTVEDIIKTHGKAFLKVNNP